VSVIEGKYRQAALDKALGKRGEPKVLLRAQAVPHDYDRWTLDAWRQEKGTRAALATTVKPAFCDRCGHTDCSITCFQ
jgi:hypothetical protein